MKDRFFEGREDKFICFVRYMIKAAREKRCVPYSELMNITGLSRKQIGVFSAKLAVFCDYNKWPFLNSLIINLSSSEPSGGFDDFMKKYSTDIDWRTEHIKCWKRFHVPEAQGRGNQFFSGLDAKISKLWDKLLEN